MYAFAVGLLLVALQVSCNAAPSDLIPEPKSQADEKLADVPQEIPGDVFQEKFPDVPQEKHLEKRAGK